MFKYLFMKEIKEHIFSLKGIFWMMLAAIMFSILAYSFITVKELSVLAQIEIITTFMRVVLGFGMLLTIIFAASAVSNEKEQGTLESLMLTPLSKGKLILGKWMSVMAIWIIIAIIAAPYLITLSGGTTVQGSIMLYLFVFATIIVSAFSAFALALSALLQSSKNAIMVAVGVFLVFALPAFLGTTVKKTGFGSIVDMVSPLAGAIRMIKDLFINKLAIIQVIGNSLSVVVFAVLAFIFLSYATKKLSLLGGE